MAEANEQNSAWLDKISPEDKAYMTIKGWDKHPDPATALPAVLTSYREIEKKMGAPADKLVRWPDEGQPMDPIFQRLGVPDAADKYAFDGVEDTELVDLLRNVAFANKLTPAQAKGLADSFTGTAKTKREAAETAATVNTQAEDLKLRAAWGGDYDVQLAITDRFLEKSPFTPSQKAAFTGSAQGRQMLYAIASGDKEANSHGINTVAGGGTPKMSPEEAKQTLESRKADRAWVAKWRTGDPAAVQEFTNLTALMVPRRQ